MKSGLGLALAGLAMCLWLVLGPAKAATGMDHHLCIARGQRSVGSGEQPPLPSLIAAPTQNPGAPPAPPGVSDSLSVESKLLPKRSAGLPWWDSRGPPGKVRGTLVNSRAAGQTDSPRPGVANPNLGSWTRHHAPERGFATAFN